MKPKKIFLVRHGQSKGNLDRAEYYSTPDYAVKLTEIGKTQAKTAGEILLKNSYSQREPPKKDFFFYLSPFFRTRETFQEIAGIIGKERISYREDPRIREQEWNGRLATANGEDYEKIENERDSYGTFYYRFERGESCADVYDRASLFLDSLWRDFEKPDFPQNCVIVSHGMFIRVFLMRWFHMPIEEFERIKNPANGAVISMTLTENGKYELDEPLKRWDGALHPYQMPITL